MNNDRIFSKVERWGKTLCIALCMTTGFLSCNVIRNSFKHADMRADTTLLGLFYGMEEEGDAICPLDTLLGVLKLDCLASWKTGEFIEDVTAHLQNPVFNPKS